MTIFVIFKKTLKTLKNIFKKIKIIFLILKVEFAQPLHTFKLEAFDVTQSNKTVEQVLIFCFDENWYYLVIVSRDFSLYSLTRIQLCF